MIQNKCRICNNNVKDAQIYAQIFGKEIKYYECDACSYVQTEHPYWLDKAYENPINLSDTGIIARNIANRINVITTLKLIGKLKLCTVVDYAGGYGFLTRMLRDIGINAYWSDPYTTNLTARGFEYEGQSADLVTSFETFEHFDNPNRELDKLFSIAPNVLVSTDLIPQPTPDVKDWWYYGEAHGQHVGFYRIKTLEHIASRYGKYLLSDGKRLHLFTDKKYSRIRWLAMKKFYFAFPQILFLGMKSLTWEDHLMLQKFDKK